jgi:hypothetical protein
MVLSIVFVSKDFSVFVMAGLVPAIHVFLADPSSRRGCEASSNTNMSH